MFLAIREMMYAKLRYFLIGFIMVLITWLVFMIAGLANGLSADNASAIQQINANSFILQSEAESKINRSQVNMVQWKSVEQQVKEGQATPLGVKMAAISKIGKSKKIDITVFAVDPKEFLMPVVIQGKSMNNNEKREVVVDQSLQQEGINIGDWIVDTDTSSKWKVVGFTKNKSYSHSPVIFMNLSSWKAWTKKDTFQAIVLRETDSKIKIDQQLEFVPKEQVLESTPGYKEEQGSLQMMIAFLFVIASFIQAVFFYVITLQKSHQFGVLKAIGANTKFLAQSVVAQILSISIVTVVVSIGLTYGSAFVLPDSVPFLLETNTSVGFSVLMIVVSLVGALLSVYHISKVEAIDAIGRVE
ncbi:ABC transporter permease [Shimazuella kribbensis]|uniref:ABC transporter permease n=1 Tax=Shimazuella kribbensis TaxID=139808 RepID=UPI00040E3D89|nr:ABC transporter permease [Shimazuella kribbensis]